MKKLLYLMFGLFISGCSSQPKFLNEAQYTKKYFKIISKKYPEVIYEIKEPLVLKASYGKGKSVTHYLDNSYREYKLDPNDLDDIIEKYTNASAGVYTKSKEIDINRIVPVIKPSDYFEQLKTLGNSTYEDFKVPELIWEPYNEDLIIVYAEDRDNNINYFNQEEFEKLEIARDSLLEFSVNNLSNIVPKIETVGENGNFGLIAGGDYEVSLMLMTSIWTKENFDVDGEIVIAIPNRDLVFITGSNDNEAIEKLKNTVQESYETGNHSVSRSFYKWNGEKFEKL
ncbi:MULTISPECIES: DUF1444 family protein [Flavobacteriaceae]|uniref:DUF1444 family protein n=1 Tax=Flagellimonas alvinocaridis TaxID=2530200 RepID=A0A4S8RMI3_9FLAO|nr:MULTISPECIES: DUF1444 family protein [Allomuricauda]MDC6361504.1 DUF1444 family protein [Muricauda sp. SP22]THV58861.1 DUF1444 family protein [Allomuricauda alvinocaridis]